jgi:hypothetical protein
LMKRLGGLVLGRRRWQLLRVERRWLLVSLDSKFGEGDGHDGGVEKC